MYIAVIHLYWRYTSCMNILKYRWLIDVTQWSINRSLCTNCYFADYGEKSASNTSFCNYTKQKYFSCIFLLFKLYILFDILTMVQIKRQKNAQLIEQHNWPQNTEARRFVICSTRKPFVFLATLVTIYLVFCHVIDTLWYFE